MDEKKVEFLSDEIMLVGMLGDPGGEKGVVVTHPHPQYGGSMHNNVVDAVVEAYAAKGYATLKFNFRGVEGSEGVYSEGIGEQDDISAALKKMKEIGKTQIDIAGYSFGAWVITLGLDKFLDVRGVVMVSPPVNFLDFSHLKENSKIQLVIGGSQDDIAPPSMIEKQLPGWNPSARFEIIEGADHFYWGSTEKIKNIISSFLE